MWPIFNEFLTNFHPIFNFLTNFWPFFIQFPTYFWPIFNQFLMNFTSIFGWFRPITRAEGKSFLRLTYGWPTGDLWVEHLDEVEVIGVNKGRRKSTCKSYCSAARWQLLHFFEFLCEFPCEFVSISLGGLAVLVLGCVGGGLPFCSFNWSKLGRNWGEIGVKCIKNWSKWIEKCNLNTCHKNVNTIGWN